MYSKKYNPVHPNVSITQDVASVCNLLPPLTQLVNILALHIWFMLIVAQWGEGMPEIFMPSICCSGPAERSDASPYEQVTGLAPPSCCVFWGSAGGWHAKAIVIIYQGAKQELPRSEGNPPHGCSFCQQV